MQLCWSLFTRLSQRRTEHQEVTESGVCVKKTTKNYHPPPPLTRSLFCASDSHRARHLRQGDELRLPRSSREAQRRSGPPRNPRYPSSVYHSIWISLSHNVVAVASTTTSATAKHLLKHLTSGGQRTQLYLSKTMVKSTRLQVKVTRSKIYSS